jgi:hypothetical protein
MSYGGLKFEDCRRGGYKIYRTGLSGILRCRRGGLKYAVRGYEIRGFHKGV